MASTNTITDSYAGEVAGEILRPVVVTADSYVQNRFKIWEAVKYKLNIPILTVSGNIVQDYACDYTPDGSSTVVESVITPTKLMTNHTVCKSIFRDTWWANDTGSGFANDQIPAQWDAAFLEAVGEEIMRVMEFTTWQGNFESSAFDKFDGILAKADAASGTIKQDISALTAGNIQAQIQLAVDAMTSAMIGDDRFKIKLNRSSYHLLLRSYGNTFNNLIYDKTKPLIFEGYDIEVCPGIPNNVVVIAKTDDLHVGVDLTSDFTNVSVVDTSQTLNDDNVRFAARYAVGTAVTNASQIVLAGVGIES